MAMKWTIPADHFENVERCRAIAFNLPIKPHPGEDWRDCLRRQVAITRRPLFSREDLESFADMSGIFKNAQ